MRKLFLKDAIFELYEVVGD